MYKIIIIYDLRSPLYLTLSGQIKWQHYFVVHYKKFYSLIKIIFLDHMTKGRYAKKDEKQVWKEKDGALIEVSQLFLYSLFKNIIKGMSKLGYLF